jgi:large subunit ribosomal protein L44e
LLILSNSLPIVLTQKWRAFLKSTGVSVRNTWPHKVTQNKDKNSLYAQQKKHYDRKQRGYVWWADQADFPEKAQTTRETVLSLECVEPSCRAKRTLAPRDATF